MKPDERIIRSLRRVIEKVQPQNASIRYDGACAHPLTASQTYTTGMVAGRVRTLEDLYIFLGENGYIDMIKWNPYGGHDYLMITTHHGGGALCIVNCFREETHYAGLRGAKWMPERSTPEDEVDPNKVRHHVVDTEEELIELVLRLIAQH
jgi:hypothetical protein